MANPLGYEPHADLSINSKSAEQCASLAEVRYEIDTIDHLLVKLIHVRMQYALQTLKFKADGKPIPDNQRIAQQLKKRKEWAVEYHLDPLFIQSFFKLLIDWYMTEQIRFYRERNPQQEDLQIRFASLAKLKAMEYQLDWLEIDRYDQLIDSAYAKSQQINGEILVSFTQQVKDFAAGPVDLFEHVRRLSLPDAFLLADPPKQSFLCTFGKEKHFSLDYQSWKDLLTNSIIEKSTDPAILSYGPLLTSTISFDSNQSSLTLPRIQLHSHHGDTFITLNSIVKSSTDYHLLSARLETLAQLEYAQQIFNQIERSTSATAKEFPLQVDRSEQWKAIVSEALAHIQNGHFQAVVLAREKQMPTDPNWSLTDFYSPTSSSYFYATRTENTCFLGLSALQFLTLEKKHLQYFVFNRTSTDPNNSLVDWMKQQIGSFAEKVSKKKDTQEILIEGEVRKEDALLDVVETLRRTPSTVGYPLANAAKFLEEKEKVDRRAFPAWIGWIDRHGQGQFLSTSKAVRIDAETTRLCTLFHIDQQTDVN